MDSAEPTPVRCPVLRHPDLDPADPGALDPLLRRLLDPAPVTTPERFPLGTLQPDGRVDLCKQGLGPLGAQRVAGVVARSPHATHLLLGTNTLGADGAAALAGTLEPGHRLHTLYLGCNRIDATGLRPLTERLATDATVRAVWLKRNPIGDAGVAAVAAALRRNTTIRTLDLTNTAMSPDGLAVLVDALCARPVPVHRLYLGGNGFGPTAAPLLVRLVREAGVRALYLAASHLGDDGVRALAGGLPTTAPVTLGLGGNGITPAGTRALAARLDAIVELDLARPPSGRALNATPNHVGDEGALALAGALPGSPLRRLELRHTGVTGRGAKALLAAARAGTALEVLGLGAGTPRRVKRAVVEHLRPAAEPHADVRAITSVYR